MTPLPHLVADICGPGEHLSKNRTPVVCVPNKRADDGPLIDPKIIDTAWAILTLAAVILAARAVWRFWRRRGRDEPIEGDPASGLSGGAMMVSPSLGLGDLSWGSPKHGFFVPPEAVAHHMIIAGGTGSGKTNTTEVLVHAAASTYKPQIIFFDCKGSRDGMARFLALMASCEYYPDAVPLFPVDPYDGWRGGSDPERALLGRLTQVQDWSESFYEAGTKDLLQSVLFDAVPPRDSTDFLARLGSVPAGSNPKLVEGALARYRGFFRSLKGSLDGKWAYEDCDACYIQLEGFGLPTEATALGRFLMEDLTHYLADRKNNDRPVLVVLDEFSAISTGADAANLIERAREFGAGVILTTQSYAGLGRSAERVLDAARGGMIVHSLANPDPFTSRAGTVWRQVEAITELTHQPGVLSSIVFKTPPPEAPRRTTRDQEFPKIDPNEVRQLPRGEAFVISGGRAQRVSFNRVEVWDENIELANKEIARRRRIYAAATTEEPTPPLRVVEVDPDLDF